MDNANTQPTAAPKKAHPVLRRLGIFFGTLLLIFCLTFAILMGYGFYYVRHTIMPEVRESSINLVTSETDLSSAIYYYDKSKNSYVASQTLYASENRVWVALEDIPQNLIDATVSIEDKRFWSHRGVDWRRTAAAVKYMFTGQNVQGGSTITQQLIKNLTGNDETTVRRKVQEIFEALEFERNHTKEETIEWYLNAIYLGHGCYGVSTAAEKYFGKEVGELTLPECAALISVTNNPARYDPYSQPKNNKQRQELVLDLMCDQGYISEKQRDKAKKAKIKCVYGSDVGEDDENSSSTYSWYTDAVIEQVISDLEEKYDYDETTATNLIFSGGLQIYSCLDPDVQKKVDEVYTKRSNFEAYESEKGQDLRSGITVIDNKTGMVVALAGGVGKKEGNRIWNCATDTLRPPGSAIKPLSVYAPAIEKKKLLPSSAEDDTPFSQDSDGDLWPVNSQGYYSGLTDIDTAMYKSLNTVAVKVLDEVGLKKSYQFVTEKFGITTLVTDYETSTGAVKSDLNYAPLALGGLTRGTSTLEIAAAYATFPRNGAYTAPALYKVVTDSNGKVILSNGDYKVKTDSDHKVTVTGEAKSKTILSERTVYYMNQMLEDVITEGTGSEAKLNDMTAAGKTGTTTEDHDRWFAGYTPYYTAAIWTGYDSPETIQNEANPACILWKKVMDKISKGEKKEDFKSNFKTVDRYYCTSSGQLAGRACEAAGCSKKGTFIEGDEPSDYCERHYYTSSGNMVLDYDRSGPAAKADIQGEVSFIQKKVPKKKKTSSRSSAKQRSSSKKKTSSSAKKKSTSATKKKTASTQKKKAAG